MSVARLAVSFDQDLARAIRKAARGQPTSAWLADAARRKLRAEGLLRVVASWEDEHGEITQEELRSIPRRLRLIQLLSVLIPLLGAALVVSTQPDHQLFDKKMFKILSVGLMAMGVAGIQLAVAACDAVRATISALTGRE